MRKIELLVPASSLEVLKISEQMQYISVEKPLDFVPKQRTFPMKI